MLLKIENTRKRIKKCRTKHLLSSSCSLPLTKIYFYEIFNGLIEQFPTRIGHFSQLHQYQKER